MPPPRAKLHNKTGKMKVIKSQATKSPANNLNRNVPVPSTSQEPEASSSTSNQQNADAEEQFVVELYWCIQQFENSLQSGKLTQKQARNIIKALKILRSSNQPVIKKRQIMRGSFGDYRTKMAEEEKKYSLGAKQIKFTNSGPSVKGKKSYFIKKSALLESGSNFKFNFPIDEIEQLNISDEKCVEQNQDENGQLKADDNLNKESTENKNSEQKSELEENANDLQNFKYIPSGNTFRFNFNVDVENK